MEQLTVEGKFEDLIRNAINVRVSQIVEEETDKAQREIKKRISAQVNSIVLEVSKFYSISSNENEMVIKVFNKI